MVDTAGATGSAHAPTIVVANNVGAVEALLHEMKVAEEARWHDPQLNIDGLRASIAKQEAQLADTKARLEAALQEGTV